MEGRDDGRGKRKFKVKAILFDLDGVITSERIYWNCSGLAFAKYLGSKMPESTRDKIKLARKLLPDKVIEGFKEVGVNSNWDITYAISVLADLGKEPSWLLKEMKNRGMKGLEYLKLLDEIDSSEKHDREGGKWAESHKRFQACYYELEDTDEPVIPLKKIKDTLDILKSMGLKLGIVSGRPYLEAKLPLRKWGLWNYFDPALTVTEREVSEEGKKRGEHLGKPNPYPILRAIFNNEKCEPCEIKQIAEDYILVGDSVADVLAAKNAGIPLICVRTGIASEESLRQAGAEMIVDDIVSVPATVRKLLKNREQ